jgi:hypothetical protein
MRVYLVLLLSLLSSSSSVSFVGWLLKVLPTKEALSTVPVPSISELVLVLFPPILAPLLRKMMEAPLAIRVLEEMVAGVGVAMTTTMMVRLPLSILHVVFHVPLLTILGIWIRIDWKRPSIRQIALGMMKNKKKILLMLKKLSNY